MREDFAMEQEDLLNIRQAAEYLGASAVSLRRWTDSGRLKCYRIGGRRERRFRREDLQAFLEEHESQAVPATDSRPVEFRGPVASLLDMTVAYGTHLCSLYESDRGRLKLAVPFLCDGLEKGDVCYFVASPPVIESVTEAMKKVNRNMKNYLREGKLRISEGEDSAESIYHFFETELFHITQSGQSTVRVLGDMSWFLDRGMTVDDLVDFELRYNHNLAQQYPVISLCQFDARRFDGMGILNALKCHEETFSYPLSRFIGI